MKKNSGLILALDVDNLAKAAQIARRLSPEIKIFKIGSQLFTGYGPKAVALVRRQKREVFLDLKFYDIPNTVANAVRQAVRLKVKMLTLHISGGEQMLLAAVKAAREEARRLRFPRPLLIGVTVLTSREAAPGEVVKLARQGLDCGLDGVVASVREAAELRRVLKRDFLIVTPGIRPGNAGTDDQKRVATAEQAVQAGSDFLVVGRPILEAADPLACAKGLAAVCRKRG